MIQFMHSAHARAVDLGGLIVQSARKKPPTVQTSNGCQEVLYHLYYSTKSRKKQEGYIMNLKYFSLYRWTFEHMKGAERFVYAYIDTFSGNGTCCGASQEYIASRLKISVRTVKYAIKRLTAAGYILTMAAGKRKERNEYTVNHTKAEESLRAWQIRNSTAPHSMPDVLRVYDGMIQAHGAGAECLLIANLYQLQTAAEKTDTVFAGGVHYGQKALAEMCGCSLRKIKDALQHLEEMRIIEISIPNITWNKSRRVYQLNESAEIALVNVENSETGHETGVESDSKCRNCTCKPNEGAEIALVNGNESAEIAPNEYIYSMNTFSVMNTALDSAARESVSAEKTVFSESDESKNPDAEMKSESAEESKQADSSTESKQAESKRGYQESLAAFFADCEKDGITKENTQSVLTEQPMKARTRERAAEVEQAKKELNW